MNKKIVYSMRVVHSTVGTLVHRLHYIPIKAWSCAIQVEWCTGYQDYAVYSNAFPILHITFVLHTSWIAGLAANTTSVR
jgi:hypothetical protein